MFCDVAMVKKPPVMESFLLVTDFLFIYTGPDRITAELLKLNLLAPGKLEFNLRVEIMLKTLEDHCSWLKQYFT